MVESEKAEKESKNEGEKIAKFFHSKANIWMAVSVVLAVALVISIAMSAGLSKSKAGEKLVSILNERVGGGVELASVTDLGNVYTINVSYKGEEIPVYMTKDGKYMVMGLQELNPAEDTETETDSQTSTEVPKTDKPKVELYIWGYCPYGVAAQGPLAEVAELLKSSADFEAVAYYDGHGAFETQQNKIQACIQRDFKTLYWKYAAKFVTDVYPKCGASRDISCDKNESVKIMNAVGIDSSKVMKCVESDGASLIAEYSSRAQANDVSGSPTLMINGVAVSAARNAEAYKAAVCAAFNTAPSACSKTLDSADTAASGNC